MPLPVPAVIPTRVRERRKQLNMTQTALAKKSGLTQSGISRIENSLAIDPQITSMLALMDALGCSFIEELTE